MASNYTENYQLPIWAADDAFLRTEFNEANEKIDAAIASCAQANRVVKIAETVTTSDAAQVDLDLTGTDWSNFSYLRLLVHGAVTSDLLVRVNGITSQTYYSMTTNTSTSSKNDSLLTGPTGALGLVGNGILMAFPGERNLFAWVVWGALGSSYLSWPNSGLAPIPLMSLAQLNFSTSGVIKTGSRFELFGILR